MRLRQLRRQQGLTQGQLAKKARVTQAYIAQLESGQKKNPADAVVRRLAKALGVSEGNLMGGRWMKREEELDKRFQDMVFAAAGLSAKQARSLLRFEREMDAAAAKGGEEGGRGMLEVRMPNGKRFGDATAADLEEQEGIYRRLAKAAEVRGLQAEQELRRRAAAIRPDPPPSLTTP